MITEHSEALRVAQRQDSSFISFARGGLTERIARQNRKDNGSSSSSSSLAREDSKTSEVFEVADLTAAFAFQYDVTLRGG
jgi:hypothetical protein